MVPEARKDLLRMLIHLPHHELVELFNMLHIAVDGLDYESIDERVLMDHFMTAFWKASKREQ